jgi:hypothetical protein
MLTGSSAGLKVSTKDTDMAKLLQAQGTSVEADTAAVWATSASDMSAATAPEKIVIVSEVEPLAKGGCLALVEEGGRMVFYLQNLQETGKSVSDTVMRASRPDPSSGVSWGSPSPRPAPNFPLATRVGSGILIL